MWKCMLDPENSTSNIIIINSQHHPPLISWFFPILLLFSFSIATLSIFGNVHYTLKSLPNIITNSEHPPLFLPVKFPLFYHYFSLTKAPISIFGSAQWPRKTVSTTAELTNAPYSPAWVIATYAKKWQVFCWNEDPWHPDRPEKYILTTSLSQNIS